MKAVTIEQNGQDVLVAWVPNEATAADGADVQPTEFPSEIYPAASEDIRQFVDSNANRSFNLYKYVAGEIVCRSVEELTASEWLTWNYNWQVE